MNRGLDLYVKLPIMHMVLYYQYVIMAGLWLFFFAIYFCQKKRMEI